MEYWKWKAIDKLQDYSQLKASLLNLPDGISILESEAVSIQRETADGASATSDGSGQAGRLLSNNVNLKELEEMLFRAERTVRAIERGLQTLTEKERYVLNLMYIEPVPNRIEVLKDELCYSENKSVYRVADSALLKFTRAMYGCTET